MERNTLMKMSDKNLSEILEAAESMIVISMENDEMYLSFSDNLSEMEVLDILSITTNSFYEVAEEDPSDGI
jgi:hypothetical protein|tara:strand:- start:4021 stop:4233 length:213 start_codon:yes stop_codon:yes gene_type:complete